MDSLEVDYAAGVLYVSMDVLSFWSTVTNLKSSFRQQQQLSKASSQKVNLSLHFLFLSLCDCVLVHIALVNNSLCFEKPNIREYITFDSVLILPPIGRIHPTPVDSIWEEIAEFSTRSHFPTNKNCH